MKSYKDLTIIDSFVILGFLVTFFLMIFPVIAMYWGYSYTITDLQTGTEYTEMLPWGENSGIYRDKNGVFYDFRGTPHNVTLDQK